MEKYFYVRQDSTIGNDDDETNGSTVFKVSDLISMGSASNTALLISYIFINLRLLLFVL